MRHSILVPVVAAAVVLGALVSAPAQDDAAARKAAFVSEVRTLLAEGDSYAAAERIQRDGSPEEVAARYAGVLHELYWQAKALPECVAVGRAGILWCLTRSKDAADDDARRSLRVTAQQMSFDLASFAWPAWDEKGIVVGPAELAAGLDAARLDLRLVRELGYPPEKHANAHWIVGAQLLAAGRHGDARAEFEASRASAQEAQDAEKEWMAHGYVGIVDALAGPDRDAGRAQVDEARARLNALGSEDATFLAEQLRDVLAYFTRD